MSNISTIYWFQELVGIEARLYRSILPNILQCIFTRNRKNIFMKRSWGGDYSNVDNEYRRKISIIRLSKYWEIENVFSICKWIRKRKFIPCIYGEHTKRGQHPEVLKIYFLRYFLYNRNHKKQQNIWVVIERPQQD